MLCRPCCRSAEIAVIDRHVSLMGRDDVRENRGHGIVAVSSRPLGRHILSGWHAMPISYQEREGAFLSQVILESLPRPTPPSLIHRQFEGKFLLVQYARPQSILSSANSSLPAFRSASDGSATAIHELERTIHTLRDRRITAPLQPDNRS